jgi:predicted O-methyltransferase YrrM
MAISMAIALPPSALLVTIEKDPVNHAAAAQILAKALGIDALELAPGYDRVSGGASSADWPVLPRSQPSARVESWRGASGEVLEGSAFQRRHARKPFDLVLMDHWKPEVNSTTNQMVAFL